MSYKSRSLFRLLEDIESNKIFLPHIQRAFVWEDEQMILLFDSLMREYPIQTLLFWRTKEEIKARRFMSVVDRDADLSELYDSNKSKQGVEKTLVLDGQQRLQTLYAIFRGAITDEHGDSAEAYMDITAGAAEIDGGELLHRLVFSSKSLELLFYRIRDLTERHAQINPLTIADDFNDILSNQLNEAPELRKARERRVRENFHQLHSILHDERHFWIDELDGIANHYAYRKILDIFMRVNSGGTKLKPTDLMFAAMKEGWDEIEEHIEQTVDLLNSGRRGFDEDFPLKCLLITHNQGVENQEEKFKGAKGETLLKQMEADWDRTDETFRQLRDFIEHDLRLFSDKIVRSYSAFVPLFDFLYHNPKPNERNRLLMRAYYHKAQLFNWYGGKTDILNALHSIVGYSRSDGFPLDEIKAYFRRSPRGAIVNLTEEHLNDNRLRNILLSMVYVERWGVSPFNVLFKGNEPQVDHIYPQYMLRKHLDQRTAEINDIGNLRFVGATDNIRKRAELPSTYFARLKIDGIDIKKHLLVADYAEHPEKLVFDIATYTDFRQRRKAEIWRLLKRVVDPELDMPQQ